MKRVLLASLTALLAAACVTEIDDEQGKACDNAADCRRPYSCVQIRPAVRTCEILALPVTGDVPEGNVDAGQPYFCSDVGVFLNKYCVDGCHGEDRTGSGQKPFRLDYYDPPDAGALPGAHQFAAKIKQRTFDQRDMPPFGSPLPTDTERVLIRNWVVTGARECDAGQ
jgi:hypothetical protein